LKKGDHVMINISWGEWPKFAAERLQIFQKFEAYLIHAMNFASFELFSVAYLGLHLVRKCETQKTY